MSNFIITKVTAFVSIDPKTGDEGLIAFNSNSGWMPLICADENRIKQMLPVAQKMSAQTGTEYKIVEFGTRTDVTDQVKNKYSEKS